ncbi:MAG: sulfotransferase [Vicinamibacteria bacterium]|nr:sulfotransferase [Vicinamibacteria bacterium]
MQDSLRRLYRRIRYGQPIVVVSGLPRSGTSMLMKMLDAGGVPLVMDGLRAADEDNPKGYFEDERIKNLAAASDKRWIYGTRAKAIKVVSYLLKSLPRDNNYKVLFVRRDPREILASQKKMLARRGEKDDLSPDRMIEIYESDLWRATYLLAHQPQFETLDVRYADVVARPLDQAKRINEFLGGRLDVDAMAAAVDPALYRNRAQA